MRVTVTLRGMLVRCLSASVSRVAMAEYGARRSNSSRSCRDPRVRVGVAGWRPPYAMMVGYDVTKVTEKIELLWCSQDILYTRKPA